MATNNNLSVLLKTNTAIALLAIAVYFFYFMGPSIKTPGNEPKPNKPALSLDLSLDYSFFDEIGSYLEGASDSSITVIGVHVQGNNLISPVFFKEFGARLPYLCLQVVNGDVTSYDRQIQTLREFKLEPECGRTVLILHGNISIPAVLQNSNLFDGTIYGSDGKTLRAAGLSIVWFFDRPEQWTVFNSSNFPDRLRQRFIFFNL